jgi:exopolyphosphatase / guanosine-5'-triphosphate,3'-diphosphate pyrophosphatase
MPTRCSILDLGSNSFHVLVADLDGRAVTPLVREREMLHLGRTVALHGRVPPAEHARAVSTVAHRAEPTRRAGATESLAVATAALRDAANGPAVIADLQRAAGTRIRVLDGLEEARLAYLGVRAAVAVREEPVLVLDLGGGSLELAVGSGEQIAWSVSTPLGASAMSALFAADPPRRKELRALRSRVEAHLAPAIEPIRSHAPRMAVAVGGTVRALARVAAAESASWLPATLNQFVVERATLAAIRDELLGMDATARAALPGMKERRADHIHVAAVTLVHALELLGLQAVTISDWGLREGLLLDTHGEATPPTAGELRRSEVERIRTRFVPDDPHPGHVGRLAGQLFDGTTSLHGLGAVDRELLLHAADLHSIGEALALRRQQLHGAYLLENAELRGFSPSETAMLATLVRFHRSRGIDAAHRPFASLTAADQERTRQLLALLQVADGLDRAHDQAVTDLDVVHLDDHVRLVLHGGGLHVTKAELERKTRLFAQVFDRTVRVHDEVAA